MRTEARLSGDAVPASCHRPNIGHSFVRMALVAASLFVLALVTGAMVSAALLVVSAALLAMLVERACLRGELGRALGATARVVREAASEDCATRMRWVELAYERVRSVVESLREGVLVVDEQGSIVLANPAARRAMRASALDPTGKLLWDAFLPEVAERARDAWRALREKSLSPTELPQVRYAGIACRDNVYDLTAVGATSSRTGQSVGTVFLLVDATHTFELQRLKDRFLSSVSHELRTPLTNIVAFSELLTGMPPGEAEWSEFVRVIHEEGMQLSGLVDGMFDYLQLESGEAVFVNEPVDGAEIVRRLTGGLAATVRQRRLHFEVSIADDTPRLIADRRRLEQVVRNLIDNAVKFTPDGGSVRVTLGSRDDGWELRIEDSGPGVPPVSRNSVFEKFSQLGDPLTEKVPGTGIGLATSRAIVTRLGGLVWCEDSPLGGAGFVVLLPGIGQPRLATLGSGYGAF